MKAGFSLFLLIISLIFTIIGFSTLPIIGNGRPGPGFFPILIGIAMVILTAINFIKDFREQKEQKPQEQKDQEQKQNVYMKDVVWITIIILGFVALLKVLGGLIAMIVFTFLILLVFNRGKMIQNSLYSIIFPVAIYALFEWLNAGLPEGIFGF